MRIVSNRIFVLIVFLLGVLYDMAAAPKGPPSPTAKKKQPIPPGWPVDENIYILLIGALLLGIYIIYKHKLKTKTPM
jgi:hypothetical protein